MPVGNVQLIEKVGIVYSQRERSLQVFKATVLGGWKSFSGA